MGGKLMLLSWLLADCLLVNSFTTGPPASACDDMLPSGHVVAPQTGPAPFTITLSSNVYTPGEILEVTLESSGPEFVGFFAQARSADDERLGNFSADGLTGVVTLCSGQALSHSQRLSATSLTVSWTAPLQDEGDVEFRVTFVQSFTVFWVQEKSATVSPRRESTGDWITDGSITGTTPTRTTTPSTPTPSTPTPPPQPSIDIDLGSCGLAKGCYRSPADCVVDECEYVLTWAAGSNNDVNFEMQAKVDSSQNYVAIAFSNDMLMGDDSVVDCIVTETSFMVHSSYNLDNTKFNAPLDNPDLGLDATKSEGSRKDGAIACRFTRQKSMPASKNDGLKFFNVSNSYFLLMAKGISAGTTLSRHNSLPITTVNKTSVGEGIENIGGSTASPSVLVKAHGALMTVGWMLLVSIAIVLPRSYKKTFDKMTSGKALWFQLHQPFMVIALLCVVAGFIIIFVHVRGYSSLIGAAVAHPPLGIIATICIVINPLMSICRCAPDHPKRIYFNAFHQAFGSLGWAAAAVTIVIGLFQFSVVDPWCRWVGIAWIAWCIVFGIVIPIYDACGPKAQVSDNAHQMDSFATGEKAPEVKIAFGDENRGKAFKTTMYVLHCLVCAGCAISIVVSIART